MILSFGPVRLRKVEISDLEMLRRWRNDSKISQHMFYQEHITREMQEAWYRSLSKLDYYFVIEESDNSVGLIHLNVDDNKTAFAGLFIYDEGLWGTPVPVLASLCLLQFAFEELKLEKVEAKVRMENNAAINYNKNLGFELEGDELMCIYRDDFYTKTKVLIYKSAKIFKL